MQKSTALSDKIKATQDIIAFFKKRGIDVLPIKTYDPDDDLDMVLLNRKQRREAVRHLLEAGYYLRNNLSKIRERDKDFYYLKDFYYKVHLHRAISWNTVDYLDIKQVWSRKIIKDGIHQPSLEDEILIIAAHTMFENKHITKTEFDYYQTIDKSKVDWDYIRGVAEVYNWSSALEYFLEVANKKERFFTFFSLLKVGLRKLGRDFVNFNWKIIPAELFAYLPVDTCWCYRKALKAKRKINA